MSDIKAEAEALGIKVDGRWSDERISEEIAKVKKPSAPAMAEVRAIYDIWDADGVRREPGEVVRLPIEAARKLLADGKAARTDELKPL